MMPTLTAEESLNGAQRVMVGSGMHPPSAVRPIEAAWRRQAKASSSSTTSLAPTTPEALAQMGIAVVRASKVKV